MTPTQKEKWDNLRRQYGALFYHEHTPENQAVIRAAMHGKAPGKREQALYLVAHDQEAQGLGFSDCAVYLCSVTEEHIREGRIESHTAITVEDHKTHWRVRWDGRYDKWESVPKA